MIVPPTRQAAADDFLLTAGLLKAHILDRVPIEKLAQDYGFSPARLRTRLLDHVAACFVAIGGPEANPVAPPADPFPAAAPVRPTVRIRERIAPPAPAARTRIRAVRSA